MDIRLYEIALNTARKLVLGRAIRILKEEIAEFENLAERKASAEANGIYLGLKRALQLIQAERNSTND